MIGKKKKVHDLLLAVTLCMCANGQEEFLFQIKQTKFTVRSKPMGLWPAPGEATSEVDHSGGLGTVPVVSLVI